MCVGVLPLYYVIAYKRTSCVPRLVRVIPRPRFLGSVWRSVAPNGFGIAAGCLRAKRRPEVEQQNGEVAEREREARHDVELA